MLKNLFTKNNVNNILTVLFLILMVYLIGIMISNVVDRRLSDIEIRMPRIEIRPEQFRSTHSERAGERIRGGYKQWGGVDVGNIGTGPLADSTPPAPLSTPSPSATATAATATAATATAATGPAASTAAPAAPAALVVDPIPELVIVETEPQETSENTPAIEVECTKDEDCNPLPGQSGNLCLVDKTCYCTNGSGSRCADNTYYKDPKQMTPEQIHKFKYRSNFAKMTQKDYYNWLMVWKGDVNNLAKYFPTHLANYEKALTDKPVTLDDLKTAVVLGINKQRFSGLNTAQNLYDRYFASPGSRVWGEYPEIFAPY